MNDQSINRFGTSVALAGRNLVVGSPGALVNGLNQGPTYHFQRAGTNWTCRSRLTANDGRSSDGFGGAVAINGGVSFVGAPNVSDNFNTSTGAAYVFAGFAKNASTPGQFRPTDGFAYLRNSNDTGFANVEFFYGIAGDVPVAGDWNGDGIDTIGVFRAGTFPLRNSNTTGVADIEFFYGAGGDKPVAGDWNGDGIDSIGVVRGNQWLLRNTNTTGFADFGFFYGTSDDTPITGDWDGR